MIIITVCCHLVQINELVVICLHHELRLLTELGDPEVAHDLLVAEVVVGVQEVSLHQVPVPPALHLQAPLQGGVLGGAQQEYKTGGHSRHIGVAPGPPAE